MPAKTDDLKKALRHIVAAMETCKVPNEVINELLLSTRIQVKESAANGTFKSNGEADYSVLRVFKREILKILSVHIDDHGMCTDTPDEQKSFESKHPGVLQAITSSIADLINNCHEIDFAEKHQGAFARRISPHKSAALKLELALNDTLLQRGVTIPTQQQDSLSLSEMNPPPESPETADTAIPSEVVITRTLQGIIGGTLQGIIDAIIRCKVVEARIKEKDAIGHVLSLSYTTEIKLDVFQNNILMSLGIDTQTKDKFFMSVENEAAIAVFKDATRIITTGIEKLTNLQTKLNKFTKPDQTTPFPFETAMKDAITLLSTDPEFKKDHQNQR